MVGVLINIPNEIQVLIETLRRAPDRKRQLIVAVAHDGGQGGNALIVTVPYRALEVVREHRGQERAGLVSELNVKADAVKVTLRDFGVHRYHSVRVVFQVTLVS
jgi:hypothetical protein